MAFPFRVVVTHQSAILALSLLSFFLAGCASPSLVPRLDIIQLPQMSRIAGRLASVEVERPARTLAFFHPEFTTEIIGAWRETLERALRDSSLFTEESAPVYRLQVRDVRIEHAGMLAIPQRVTLMGTYALARLPENQVERFFAVESSGEDDAFLGDERHRKAFQAAIKGQVEQAVEKLTAAARATNNGRQR